MWKDPSSTVIVAIWNRKYMGMKALKPECVENNTFLLTVIVNTERRDIIQFVQVFLKVQSRVPQFRNNTYKLIQGGFLARVHRWCWAIITASFVYCTFLRLHVSHSIQFLNIHDLRLFMLVSPAEVSNHESSIFQNFSLAWKTFIQATFSPLNRTSKHCGFSQRMFILHICQQIVTMSRLFFTQDNTASTLLLLYVNMSVFCAYTIPAFTCWRLKVIMCVGFELSVPEHVYLFVLINSLFLVLGWCDTLSYNATHFGAQNWQN